MSMKETESLFPEGDSEDSAVSDKNKDDKCCPSFKCSGLSSKTVLKSLLLGQALSVLLSGVGVFSGLLQEQGVNVPTAQNFPMYCLLCLLFTTRLACNRGERTLGLILRKDGWKYFLLSVVDVEANFLVIKAYAYTSVTSVQVLDCFSIAAALVLSRVFLRVRYKILHYAGVFVCILGLGGLIGADILTGKNEESTGNNVLLGDVSVIAGAILYGVSNVGEEFFVKKYNKCEFLGMYGLFGCLVSGIQVICVERDSVANIDFTSYKVVLPFVGFIMFSFLIYACMSYVIEKTSATLTNISILSADFYSLILGIFVFKYTFHFLYFMSFVAVIIGVAVYSLRPTEDSSPSHVTQSVNDNENESKDNPS